MRKIYKSLTEEQIKRGVIFSSCLSKYTTEQKDNIIHEVTKQGYTEKEQEEKILRLLDDRFFNKNTCGWKYNIIRSYKNKFGGC